MRPETPESYGDRVSAYPTGRPCSRRHRPVRPRRTLDDQPGRSSSRGTKMIQQCCQFDGDRVVLLQFQLWVRPFGQFQSCSHDGLRRAFLSVVQLLRTLARNHGSEQHPESCNIHKRASQPSPYLRSRLGHQARRSARSNGSGVPLRFRRRIPAGASCRSNHSGSLLSALGSTAQSGGFVGLLVSCASRF